jgi:hypothetical protein
MAERRRNPRPAESRMAIRLVVAERPENLLAAKTVIKDGQLLPSR